ncbi:MAG: DUF58 domain-containing protein [Gemmatimonadota bacterium]
MANERGSEPGARADLASPRALADLGQLELIARVVVEGFLIGLHRSPYRGFSVEFAENRPYCAGDDVRHVDWKMYARSDRYYIKQYEEETNLRGYLVVDTSRSMGWSSDPERVLPKVEYARLLASALALLLLRQGDAVGLLAFDERVRDHVSPRGARTHLSTILRSLTRLAADGRTDAGSAILDVAVRLRRRGLVILLSDLLVDPQGTRRALRYLRHRGHEVLILHLMDPAERDLPAAGDAIFFDPESGEELRTNSAALRREYRDSVSRAVAAWRLDCLRMKADYELVTTDTPFGLALRRYLDKRARLG